MRVLFYCHNVLGLGHIARSLTLVRALRRASRLQDRGIECGIVTGCRFLDALDVPADLPVWRLPPARLGSSGRLFPVAGGGDVVAARRERLLEILSDQRPDVLVVDQRPLGLGGELLPSLHAATEERWGTRFVWGIPYLDNSRAVLPRPRNPRIRRGLAAYCLALVYDEPDAFDVRRAYGDYGLPDTVVHTGLVTDPPPDPGRPLDPPRVTAMVGGGTGGAELLELVLHATREARLAGRLQVRHIRGPFGTDGEVESVLRDLPDGAEGVEILDRARPQEALEGASVVVSRVGYNTSAMLLASPLPLIFAPLSRIGDEQTSRAHRLTAHDGVWLLAPDAPDPVARLTTALDAALRHGRSPRSTGGAGDGADIAAQTLLALADAPPRDPEDRP